MMTSFILSLDKAHADALATVGGKGANLIELTQAGFNVPPGFCVTTHAFARFMTEVKQDIYSLLNDISVQDIEGLRRTGKMVRDYLDAVPLPSDVETVLVKTWLEHGKDYAYAVRSSATAEDLPYASFAGQQDTYLNVCGQDALVASVKACFVSLFTDRAILYRIQNGFDHRQVALAVVVQRMVQPDVSGILFTADPITGNRHISAIDASFGLGEALVSGLVSADLYQVDKRVEQIVNRQIATKQLAIRSLADGGTEQVALAEQERNKAALNDNEVIELAQIGKQIEAHYGKPQDIEWALKDGQFYITQARPITSLFPLPQPRIGNNTLRIYVSLSHFQVMTDAMPPLSLSIWRTIMSIDRAPGQIESNYIATAGGRLYADITAILHHPLGRRILIRGLHFGDQIAASALMNVMNRPDFFSQEKGLRLRRFIPASFPFALKILRALFWRKPEGASDEVLHFMDTYIASVKTNLDTAPNIEAKLKFILPEMQQLFKPILSWVPRMVAGMAATALLKSLLKKVADPTDLAAIDRGLTGNVVTNMNLSLGDIADTTRESDALMTHLRQKHIEAKTRIAGAADLPGGKTFLIAWERFINIYGSRGPSEIDLSRPRWTENPSSLLQMVVNATKHSETGAHRAHYQKLIAQNEAAAANLIAAAQKGWLGWIRGVLTRRLLRVSRNLAPLREHHKFFAIQMLTLFKPLLIDVGKQLEDEGRLNSAEDIWFLTIPEVLETFDTAEKSLKGLVATRQSAFTHAKNLTPPHVITSEGEIPIAKLTGVEAPEGALIGSPVSAGVVEGIAKVVLDPSMETLEPGEILVAPFTDPGWTPLFVNAAGLITEVGGLMTHGSVVAREYGIPAVVGVLNVTKQIKTGQRVRVHGDVGYIEILEDRDNPSLDRNEKR